MTTIPTTPDRSFTVPTIDHAAGGQSYVNVTGDGKVRIERADVVQPEGDLDARSARARAVELRAEADALDSAADHVLANHLDHTFAVLERLIVGPGPAWSFDDVRTAAANVRGLLEEATTGEPYEPATLPTPALEAAPTIA